MGILLLRSSVVSEGGGGENLSALRFPTNVSGSDTAAPYAVIKFANPQDDGLPVWGPGNAGVTVIRRIRTEQQTGYYAQFWWSQDDGSFGFDETTLPYWGAHPYPTNKSNTGTSHVWEVASQAGDFFDNFDVSGSIDTGDGLAVVHDTWLTQALRVTHNGGTKTIRFYPDLSDTDFFVQYTTTSGYGDSPDSGTDFAVTIGDSPWFAGFQHERFGGDLAWIKIIAKSMSDADILLEAADKDTLVTADAQNNIWWGKNGFTNVDDLTCDFGTGRSFTRDDDSDVLELVAQG